MPTVMMARTPPSDDEDEHQDRRHEQHQLASANPVSRHGPCLAVSWLHPPESAAAAAVDLGPPRFGSWRP